MAAGGFEPGDRGSHRRERGRRSRRLRPPLRLQSGPAGPDPQGSAAQPLRSRHLLHLRGPRLHRLCQLRRRRLPPFGTGAAASRSLTSDGARRRDGPARPPERLHPGRGDPQLHGGGTRARHLGLGGRQGHRPPGRAARRAALPPQHAQHDADAGRRPLPEALPDHLRGDRGGGDGDRGIGGAKGRLAGQPATDRNVDDARPGRLRRGLSGDQARTRLHRSAGRRDRGRVRCRDANRQGRRQQPQDEGARHLRLRGRGLARLSGPTRRAARTGGPCRARLPVPPLDRVRQARTLGAHPRRGGPRLPAAARDRRQHDGAADRAGRAGARACSTRRPSRSAGSSPTARSAPCSMASCATPARFRCSGHRAGTARPRSRPSSTSWRARCWPGRPERLDNRSRRRRDGHPTSKRTSRPGLGRLLLQQLSLVVACVLDVEVSASHRRSCRGRTCRRPDRSGRRLSRIHPNFSPPRTSSCA